MSIYLKVRIILTFLIRRFKCLLLNYFIMLLFFIVLFQVGVVMKGNYKLTYCKFLLLYHQNAPLNFLNRQIFWKTIVSSVFILSSEFKNRL